MYCTSGHTLPRTLYSTDFTNRDGGRALQKERASCGFQTVRGTWVPNISTYLTICDVVARFDDGFHDSTIPHRKQCVFVLVPPGGRYRCEFHINQVLYVKRRS